MRSKKNVLMFLSASAAVVFVCAYSEAVITAYNTFDKQVQFDYVKDANFAVQQSWGDGRLALDPSVNTLRPSFGKALKVDPNISTVCWPAVSTGVLDYREGTVEFWFAPDWNGANAGGQGVGVAGDGQIFFSCSFTSQPWLTRGLQIFIFNNGWPNDGGQVFVYWDDGWDDAFTFNNSSTQPSGGDMLGTTQNWTRGQWHHIAFCWDAASLGLYMDGGVIQKRTRTSMNPLSFSDFFLYGHGYYASGKYRTERALKGWVDDLAIWNEARYSGTYTPPASLSKIESCSDVWFYGYGLAADMNRDCKIDLKDLLKLADDWARCYDPANTNCEKTWRQM